MIAHTSTSIISMIGDLLVFVGIGLIGANLRYIRLRLKRVESRAFPEGPTIDELDESKVVELSAWCPWGGCGWRVDDQRALVMPRTLTRERITRMMQTRHDLESATDCREEIAIRWDEPT